MTSISRPTSPTHASQEVQDNQAPSTTPSNSAPPKSTVQGANHWLRDRLPSRDNSNLRKAAEEGNRPLVNHLLGKNADPNQPATLRGHSAVQLAAKFGHGAVLGDLLKNLGNPNFPNPWTGKTAVHYAAINANVSVAEALEQDLRTSAEADRQGVMPLELSARNLVDTGRDPWMQNAEVVHDTMQRITDRRTMLTSQVIARMHPVVAPQPEAKDDDVDPETQFADGLIPNGRDRDFTEAEMTPGFAMLVDEKARQIESFAGSARAREVDDSDPEGFELMDSDPEDSDIMGSDIVGSDIDPNEALPPYRK